MPHRAVSLLRGGHLLALESYNRVAHQIIHTNLFAFLDHFGVLAHQEPANVGKEEAASRIVRIGIGFRVLVVDSVIT